LRADPVARGDRQGEREEQERRGPYRPEVSLTSVHVVGLLSVSFGNTCPCLMKTVTLALRLDT
jgi:hypothetical protein